MQPPGFSLLRPPFCLDVSYSFHRWHSSSCSSKGGYFSNHSLTGREEKDRSNNTDMYAILWLSDRQKNSQLESTSGSCLFLYVDKVFALCPKSLDGPQPFCNPECSIGSGSKLMSGRLDKTTYSNCSYNISTSEKLWFGSTWIARLHLKQSILQGFDSGVGIHIQHGQKDSFCLVLTLCDSVLGYFPRTYWKGFLFFFFWKLSVSSYVYVLWDVHYCETPTPVISGFSNMPVRDPFAGILLSMNSMILKSVDVTDLYLFWA